MATRVYVKCTSELVPGNPKERRLTMANIMCQYKFGRDFDANCDGFLSLGQYAVDGIKCHFLLDVGPKEAEEYKLSWYIWDGEKL